MLTRRTLLAASAATAAAPSAFSTARAATPKGVIVMAKQIDDVITFDPAESYEFTDNECCANIYRRLVSPNHSDNTKVDGDLAQSWDVSSDGKEFTFHLKQDAVFASGKPLTAEDAAFSFQRVVMLNKTPGFILTQFGFTKDNVEKLITATDDHTLKLSLPEPFAPTFLLFCLSANVGSIVEKATVLANQKNNDLGNDWLKTHSAGAGSYQLTQWIASDHITLDANPHALVVPKTRRIAIRHVADPSAQLLLLQKGDADIARNLTPDQLKQVQGNKELTMVSSGQGTSLYLAMNEKTVPEFSKPQVRQAIKWAIDYDAIATQITPNAWEVRQGFLPQGLPGALPNNPFKRDVAKAKQLLAEAGVANGFSVQLDTVSAAPYGDIAQAVQANLADIGIKVELVPGEQRQVITKTRARTHQMVILYWGTDYFDPNSNAQAFCANPDDGDNSKLKILAWRSHFVDPELTKMVDDAVHELNGEARIKMYEDMQRLSQERSPFAMMLQQIATAALGKGVSGFALGPLPDYTRYADVEKA
ncbi:MAG: ABC transporter substrate-binding protein [Acidisphaera sp.]|nr:ABC transporter substrate-binding protein [Acidisphaera sp.]